MPTFAAKSSLICSCVSDPVQKSIPHSLLKVPMLASGAISSKAVRILDISAGLLGQSDDGQIIWRVPTAQLASVYNNSNIS